MSFVPHPYRKSVRVKFQTLARLSVSKTEVILPKGTELIAIARSSEESLVIDSGERLLIVNNECITDSDQLVELKETQLLAVDRELNAPLDTDLAKSTLLQVHEEVTLLATKGAFGICKTNNGTVVRILLIFLYKVKQRPLVAV